MIKLKSFLGSGGELYALRLRSVLDGRSNAIKIGRFAAHDLKLNELPRRARAPRNANRRICLGWRCRKNVGNGGDFAIQPYWMASGALMKAALQANMNLYACAAGDEGSPTGAVASAIGWLLRRARNRPAIASLGSPVAAGQFAGLGTAPSCSSFLQSYVAV
jgi:hypothetical protein